MKIAKIAIHYILGVIGILAISVAPDVIRTYGVYDAWAYVKEFFQFVKAFVQPESWVFLYKDHPQPILEFLWDPYVYSLQILLGAIFLGFFLAFMLAMLTVFSPPVIRLTVRRILDILESVPDVMIAFFLQFFTVYVFKKTGVFLFDFVSLGEDEPIYLAPIITLAILPMISLFKVLLLFIEEELMKHYVEFARSKGVKKAGVLFVHVLRNVVPSTFYHGKIILWGALSSLFIVETLFNMKGITYYMTHDFRPMVIAVSLLMIFTPFFIFYQIIDALLSADRLQGVPIQMSRPAVKDRFKQTFDQQAFSRWLKSLSLKNLFRSIHVFRLAGWIVHLWFTHMKNIKFAAGFTFLFGLTVYSLVYSLVTGSAVKQVMFLKNEEGKIISGPPHPPSSAFWFGSDRFGYSIFDQIIVGAKYTLFFAFLIAMLRILLGFLFSLIYAFKWKPSVQKWAEKIVDSIHFLPLSVIALLLLEPILIGMNSEWVYPFWERVWLETFILTILVVPLTTILIGNEMKLIMKQEFISSARILGGGPLHLMRTHIFPHLGPRLMVLFGQQFIQVLLIFVHLGVFSLFFGGTVKTTGLFKDPPRSFTMEWSGLIGSMRDALMTGKYWMVLFVLLAFMVSIIAMQLIIQGVKEIQQVKVGVSYKHLEKRNRRQKTEGQEGKKAIVGAEDGFTFVDQSRVKQHES
ncbi:peptide/nickel transport system permease protein [Melghiribacillus thermohalophilus]|uniref:Peptide/nickel transport system permease protein n=1 Tax=Melghiribacillus thermohalophilus TaxID=1324956 RepID=A0A4V2V2T7_9BACI|nr:ABC transporter permease subunit [Melghiribacillus thermohalophilus]TCT26346.1 peptide/nickel transport system permease protein [Melghiribacillus thermohalophilus]